MDVLTKLYNQFDPGRPLEADEVDLYVDWQAELGQDDVKKILARSIARSSHPVCRLFTGHRGVGKTTELKRVAKLLRDGISGRKLFVAFLEAEGWLDLNNPEPTDLIFSIVRKIISDLEQAGVGFARDRFKAFLSELVALVNSDVELKGLNFTLSTGAVEAELGAELKQGASRVRAQLRKLLEGQQIRIFDLVNEVIAKARDPLKASGYDDILVIVDGLERIPRKVLNDDGLTNHENLFVDNAQVLKFLACHVLYTIPVELAYSSCRKRLEQDYSPYQVLPVIPVRQPGSDEPHSEGVAALRKIVERRAVHAGADLDSFFRDRAELDRLIGFSGGHVRNLFIMLRAAIERADDLPITAQIVGDTIRRQSIDTKFGLQPKHWAILREVHRTKSEPDPDQCAEFKEDPEIWYRQLRDLFAFAYEDNGHRWYDWNPLLAVNGDQT